MRILIVIYWISASILCFAEEENINYRLPNHIEPIHYVIALEAMLEDGTSSVPFNGSVTLEFKTLMVANNVTLHTRQLNVTYDLIKIEDISGNNVEISSVVWIEKQEFLVIHLSDSLPPQETYYLIIPYFTGLIKTDNAGFYLAKYFDENGIERSFATTQFQSTNARKAFPCLDEPAMKAMFTISLIRREEYISISNEVLVDAGRDLGNGRYQDSYAKSVKMSPYLVAFAITPYSYVGKNNQRVFGRPQAIKEGLGDYSLNTGIEVIDSLSKYLSVNYSLAKIDQIAIPDVYFAPGAMENWGLVTYKESYLLYSNITSTTLEKQKTTTIIAHEFAHQWFGNLVTLNWWRYLWLNEGFAAYFQYFITSLIRPDWRIMDQFVIIALQYSFEYDSLNTTEAMNYETPYPGGGAPSYISYEKAASVIRMMANFLTDEIFQKGLTLYLETMQYNSAFPSDLFKALKIVLEENPLSNILEEIMNTWINQKGYPVVNVDLNFNTWQMELQQERFMLESEVDGNDSLWYIPINFVNSNFTFNFNNTLPYVWLAQKKLIITDVQPTDWIICNIKQTGYYRVNYNEENWLRLTNYLVNDEFTNIHVINRAQLIDDSFNLARSGRLNYGIPLKLALYLKRDVDYIPISAFLKAVTHLNTMLSNYQEYSLVKNYIINILQTSINHLGYEESDSDDQVSLLNRINVINWLCDLGEENCQTNALNQLRNIQNNNGQIKPNLQFPIYCGALRKGDENDWNFVFNEYQNSVRSNVQERLLQSLGCSQNTNVLNNFLDMINNSSLIVDSQKLKVIRIVYNSGLIGLNAAFNYVDTNFDNIKEVLPMNTILLEIANKMSSFEQLEKFNMLKMKYPNSSDIFEKPIQKIQANIKWTTKYYSTIIEVLRTL